MKSAEGRSAFADARSGAALRIRGLKKAFADVQAVDGIDLEVSPGECFGLLGPNGAGKTTTIEICEGLTTPDEGTVELLGRDWKTGADELRQRIGKSGRARVVERYDLRRNVERLAGIFTEHVSD